MSVDKRGRLDDVAVAEQVRLTREEYAEEEAEAAELEAAQNAAALEVSLSLRISREMDASLRRRAAAEQVSPSALVRRLLWKGLQAGDEPVLTARQVEEIARRVLRESPDIARRWRQQLSTERPGRLGVAK